MKLVPKKTAPTPSPTTPSAASPAKSASSPAPSVKLKPKVAAPTTSPTAPPKADPSDLDARQARHTAELNAYLDPRKKAPRKDRYEFGDLVPLDLTTEELKAVVRPCSYCEAPYIVPCDGKNPGCMNKQWKDGKR